MDSQANAQVGSPPGRQRPHSKQSSPTQASPLPHAGSPTNTQGKRQRINGKNSPQTLIPPSFFEATQIPPSFPPTLIAPSFEPQGPDQEIQAQVEGSASAQACCSFEPLGPDREIQAQVEERESAQACPSFEAQGPDQESQRGMCEIRHKQSSPTQAKCTAFSGNVWKQSWRALL